ncbi:MAG: NrfD/PsrC family molybdoenzyme membrane anchor subunit [Candidatus Methanomethylicia archaeon]
MSKAKPETLEEILAPELKIKVANKRLIAWLTVLSIFIGIGAYGVYLRFTRGLLITALSNEYPWGLWISIDVLATIALGAGAFVIAASVYCFGIHELESLVRPSVLSALIAYIIGTVALIIDIGRPDRFWITLISPNHHSIMWENVICITIYLMCLLVEFSTIARESNYVEFKLIPRIPKNLVVIAVIAGAILSTMHQSGLGGVYLVTPVRINTLWWTEFIPVLFWTSAVAGGLGMVIFESIISSKILRIPLEKNAINILVKMILFFSILYLYFRVSVLAFKVGIEQILVNQFVLMEILLCSLIPIFLLAVPKIRRNVIGLFVASISLMGGAVISRWNLVVTSMVTSSIYYPTWIEAGITIGLIALTLLFYTAAVKLFPIYPTVEIPIPEVVVKKEVSTPLKETHH